MGSKTLIVAAAVMLAATAQADVFNLGGVRDPLTGSWTGVASLETVRVGDPGNARDTWAHSGNNYGQGSVTYAYNIGRYDVTAGQYTAFLNAVAATDTYGLYNTNMADTVTPYVWGCNIQRSGSSGSYTYSVASDWANRPVNYVSWGDSARFVNWLNNNQPTGAQNLSTTEDGAYHLNGATTDQQLIGVGVPHYATTRATWASGTTSKWLLTSEDEWYKAAYYKGGSTNAGYWDYPTRSNTAPSNVSSDGYADPGNNANFRSDGYTIGSPYYRTDVGEFENSASPYGTFDQGGNVLQWNEAVLGSFRGVRGGSFHGVGSLLLASKRGSLGPTSETYELGFRVSQVPEPASMALLAIGGIGMLMRRRGLRR
ncbi:MAG: SUMF1/EgtB/PvdO family nonheme iron enzyme [Planctomycetota bacterium]|nr:SUMF1/EgtB/PvdO family nonheme iron enzyme [Planctomycetota bacterium]